MKDALDRMRPVIKKKIESWAPKLTMLALTKILLPSTIRLLANAIICNIAWKYYILVEICYLSQHTMFWSSKAKDRAEKFKSITSTYDFSWTK